MIKRTSSDVFQEATGIRILVQELEKNRRIKAYFSENDKTPNTDGYFEILRDDGLPLKRFVVQIKSVTGKNTFYNLSAGGYAYRSDSAFFQYIQNNIDSNPAIFFVIDVRNKRIFYKHLSSEFLRELYLRYLQNRSLSKQDQKKVTIHFKEDDILNEERFYNVCLEVCKDMVSVQMSTDQNTMNSGEGALDIRELQQSFENEDVRGVIDHNPKVFLSYSWAGDIYQARVLKIATWLVEHGVDVILDQWHLKYGQDMDVFMEMSIRDAEKVLILCESTYKMKADQQIGNVGRETLIITSEIYGEYNQEKFIPVVMETPEAVPTYLETRKAVFFTEETEEGYRELLRAIFDITEKRPLVGNIPSEEWLRSRASKIERMANENKTGDSVSDINTLAQPKVGRIPDWIREEVTEDKKVGEGKSKGHEALSANNVPARLMQSTLRKNERVPFGQYSQGKLDENTSANNQPNKELKNRPDVLIMVATKDEETAIISEQGWIYKKTEDGYAYFEKTDGLTFALARSSSMGPNNAIQLTRYYYSKIRPKYLAMAGFCVGRENKVNLGDVIVPYKMIKYSEGAQTSYKELYRELTVCCLKPLWKQKAENFTSNWQKKIGINQPHSYKYQMYYFMKLLLEREGVVPTTDFQNNEDISDYRDLIKQEVARGHVSFAMPDIILTEQGNQNYQEALFMDYQTENGLYHDPTPSLRVGIIATGQTDQKWDGIFDRLEKDYDKKIYALDMEAASVADVGDFYGIDYIIAKGVGGFATGNKTFDNHYVKYAIRASYHFIVDFFNRL